MIYRQGDVLIESIDAMPETGRTVKPEQGRIMLAYGEATGHHHSIAARDVEYALQDDNGALFLKMCSGSVVTHPEHAKIDLPAGTYRVTRQREYSPEEIRNVAD